VRGERLWSSLEAIIPGALAAWRRVLDVPDQATWDGQWTETKIQATAKGLGVHPDRLRRIVERETRKMGKTQASIDRFFELLGPEVGQQVSLQLRELVVVVGSLMAVIRP